MPQSLSKVYTHIIFSTKHRENLIDNHIENDLYNYIGGICKEPESNPVQIGGYKNHVHILCLLSRKIAQMKLVQEIKQGSSKWIKTMGDQYASFYWQEGYGIFSVSPSDVEKLIHYIQNQHTHHQKRTFKEEFILLLKKYGMVFMTGIFGIDPAGFHPAGAFGFLGFTQHSALHYIFDRFPIRVGLPMT